MDLRQSDRYGDYMASLNWETLKVKGNKGNFQIFIRKLGVFGSIGKIQRAPFPMPWAEVDKILKRYKVWMLKYEPDIKVFSTKDEKIDFKAKSNAVFKELSRHGFGQDNWPMLASKTILVDLTPSLSAIRGNFKKDAKYCLKRAESFDLTLNINEFDDFYNVWSRASKVKKLWIPKRDDFMEMINAFSSQAFAITAKDKSGLTVGGVFVLMAFDCAYYYYSGFLPEGKQMHVSYLLLWEAMKEAKKNGCKRFDFEGIFDQRWPNKSWLGFTHFKQSFGGQEFSFIGSFIKWRLPL
jgi:lipid II:glycine glycyltransferase (peptidoglycan interpeptide bridge formation enzyme)